jgi:hypothetical protein
MLSRSSDVVLSFFTVELDWRAVGSWTSLEEGPSPRPSNEEETLFEVVERGRTEVGEDGLRLLAGDAANRSSSSSSESDDSISILFS